jgi:hypothetical protein
VLSDCACSECAKPECKVSNIRVSMEMYVAKAVGSARVSLLVSAVHVQFANSIDQRSG